MPFGLIFGALFFAGFSGWLGLGMLAQPPLAGRLFGLSLAAFGISLALGLLSRRGWARWTGVAFAATLVVLGLNLVGTRGSVSDHLLVFASLVAGCLLLVPATGDPRRSEDPPGARPRSIGASGTVALIGLAGLLATSFWVLPGSEPVETSDPSSLPASSIGKRVRWSGFGDGLDLARAEGKPVLATFVTDWCPYCTKMARGTWRSSSVKERLGDVVAVRVDAEESRGDDGYSGAELAARYGVSGYPAQILLDADGRVIARYDGYQTSTQLLSWLDDALDRAGTPKPTLAAQGQIR